MKFAIIGSGVIGVSTAYFLRRSGHEVIVIDRESSPGHGTSFANGALLTPSMPEPWNTPGCWRVLLSSLARSDAPLQLRLKTLPELAGWGIRFLGNSSRARFEHNTISNLHLALHSLRALKYLRNATGIEYNGAARGTLRIFRNPAALNAAVAAAERLQIENLAFRKLSTAETIALEPALAPIRSELVGALYYPADEVGDARLFCEALTRVAGQQGVEYRFDTQVTSLERRGDRITALLTNRDRIVADYYVVAAGSYSAPLLQPVGVPIPIKPVKGYSITIPDALSGPTDNAAGVSGTGRGLAIPVVDDDWHAAVVPLGSAIRVAGTAEFGGFDRTIAPERIENLLTLLNAILPKLRFDPAAAKQWCGLRPVCADGVPIIGRTPIENLLINTGHGHLGWTLAAGSAQLLADIASGASPSIDPTPYRFLRFRR